MCSPTEKRPSPSIVRTKVAMSTRSPSRMSESSRTRGVDGLMRAARACGSARRTSALNVRPALTSDSPANVITTVAAFPANGTWSSSLRMSVIASLAISCAVARCAALPTISRSESRETMGRWTAPVRTLSARMRRTDASMRSRVISPRSTAATTAAMAAGMSGGMSRMSVPD